MLEINGTFFIQLANFLILLVLLNILLFRPIRRILARRHEEFQSLQETIQEFENGARQDEEGIEESKVEARKEGFQEKEKLKGEGLEEQKGLLEEAGAQVDAKLSSAQKEMAEKTAQARGGLEEQITAFSRDLAEKILGRSVS